MGLNGVQQLRLDDLVLLARDDQRALAGQSRQSNMRRLI
jgi:hypothetical protein